MAKRWISTVIAFIVTNLRRFARWVWRYRFKPGNFTTTTEELERHDGDEQAIADERNRNQGL